MSRAGVATDVNLRVFRERMKAFQRKTNCASLARFCRRQHDVRHFFFIGTVTYQRMQAEMIPEFIRQRPKLFRAPELCRPSTAWIKDDGVIVSTPGLLALSWIVCRIDISDCPGPYPVYLNNCFSLRPSKVVCFWLHDGDATRR